MKNQLFKRIYVLMGAFFIFLNSLDAKVFIENENIIDFRAVQQIELIGKELHEKTGIFSYVSVIKSLKNATILDYEKKLAQNLKEPFVLLVLAKDDKQVDIFASNDALKHFDRDGVLSPFPWSGTILPILADTKGEDRYSAAILNGYADIADQIAQNHSITLESSIGNANKNVIYVLKFIFYFFICVSVAIFVYKKRKLRAKI